MSYIGIKTRRFNRGNKSNADQLELGKVTPSLAVGNVKEMFSR
jgi:hypothetical protein